MENNYQEVPKIISGKDLDYLSDMFNWNYGAYKSHSNAINCVTDEEVKEMLTRATDVFHSTMINVLNIISEEVNNGQ